MIDLIGYRRFGHNETDEPAYTQPRMYERDQASTRRCASSTRTALVEQGIIAPEEPDRLLEEAHGAARRGARGGRARRTAGRRPRSMQLDRSASEEPETSFPLDELLELNRQLFSAPEDFNVHRKLAPQREKRRAGRRRRPRRLGPGGGARVRDAAGRRATPLRLTGQDSARGTFSQRHLVLDRRRDGHGATRRSST